MSADLTTDLLGAGTVPRPADASPVSVDWTLVRRLHEATATALAEELKRRPTLSTVAQQELARTLVQDGVDELVRQRMRAGQMVPTPAEERVIADAVFAAQFGLGRLQPYVDDPLVENIEVHGYDNVWIGYADGRDVRVDPIADSDEELVRQLQHIAARLGRAERTLTTASPLLTMRLADGSRLAAVIETVPRPHLVIRRHRIRNVDLDDMVGLRAIDRPLAEFLRAAVRARKNIVVTGAQAAGKTLMLRALANELPVEEHLATIEKHFELLLHELPDRHPRVVPFEAREGTGERGPDGRRLGEVTLTELVEQSLVMNVSRVWLGEVRGDEAWPLIEVMEAGEGGSACTLHARSAHHALERLANLCMRGRAAVTPEHAYRSCASAIDLIVHITTVDERWVGGERHRFVSQVLECNGIGEGGRPAVTDVFAPGPDGRAVPEHDPVDLADYVRVGFDPDWLRPGHGRWAGAVGGRR
ncbi:CpaF family protein [Blastococcus saxobsidens]|uniref:Flp pilus assembly protein, ATPase CpaF n=1 Tax=Blastococcus saxobsidens (strain DD2) TaxID=1146883 RepID=H6RKJ3_BLASD|nr:ATPase, T2SS/T4P/T4SS family [Blastococcus saxobsidens]CCG02412.1 Flp pilus assembly protein, ATPase CpaF [Blastococcus saxobsidens DD2]